MGKLLIAADGGPENIVLHTVAIQKLDGGPHLYDHDMRIKHQTLLVHNRLLRWGGKRFALDGIHVDDGLPGRHFPVDCASGNGGCHGGDQQKRK